MSDQDEITGYTLGGGVATTATTASTNGGERAEPPQISREEGVHGVRLDRGVTAVINGVESSTTSEQGSVQPELTLTPMASSPTSQQQQQHLDPGLPRPPTPTLTSTSEDSAEIHPMNPLRLHLRSHPERGRGVFAPARIAAGELIEESPVLVITKRQWEEGKMDDCILGSYGFCWSNGGMGIGLGLASLFNHSSSPNVNFIRNTKDNTIRFLTSRRVEEGEELCICYTADESKLWFVPADQRQAKMGSDSDSDADVEPSAMGLGADLEDDLIDVDRLEAKKERQRRLEVARAGGNAATNLRTDGSNSRSSSKSRSDPPELQAPRPMRLPSALSGSASGSGSTSRSAGLSTSETSTPTSSSPPVSAYPAPSDLSSSVLPPPLHTQIAAGNRHAVRRPTSVVLDLDWREEDWKGKGKDKGEGRQGTWGEVVRVKGPAEHEFDPNESEMNFAAVEIWVLPFTDPKMTREALEFSKEMSNSIERLRHLKRVCRKQEGGKEVVRVVLGLIPDWDRPRLSALAAAFSPSLSSLVPERYSVPKHGARSPEQLKWKNHHWPVSFSPGPAFVSDSSDWPVGKKAWVKAGIDRVLSLALEAKKNGELPVATYVTSTPSLFWPKEDGFLPPTQGLRAASSDTRVSEAHPLRHATLNCIASIAHLRTVPPFTDVPPTRNGADYLLTALTLFITHEPCVMCCMALLHSRVKEVFYVFPRVRGGGFGYEPAPETEDGDEIEEEDGSGSGSGFGYGIHARRDLNHRFEAWRWDEEVDEGIKTELEIEEDVQL